MDVTLRDFFLVRGLPPETLEELETNEANLRSIDDLACGASCEADARQWAEEVGVKGRIVKSRFVQAWLDASSMVRERHCHPNFKHDPNSRSARGAFSKLLLEAPRYNVSGTEDRLLPGQNQHESQGSSGLDHQFFSEEEVFRDPGVLSTQLKRLLRAHGVTSVEQGTLEDSLDFRKMSDFARAAQNAEDAMAIAKRAGIGSKVSQSNFARAWRAAVVGKYQPSVHTEDKIMSVGPDRIESGKQRTLSPLSSPDKLQHWDAMLPLPCTEFQSKSLSKNVGEILPAGNLLAAQEQASWAWIMGSGRDANPATALQRRLLEEYRSDSFRDAAAQLCSQWSEKNSQLTLEERIADIDDLCRRQAIAANILSEFGFGCDEDGFLKMRARLQAEAKDAGNAEVRRLQVEISAAVMSHFQL